MATDARINPAAPKGGSGLALSTLLSLRTNVTRQGNYLVVATPYTGDLDDYEFEARALAVTGEMENVDAVCTIVPITKGAWFLTAPNGTTNGNNFIFEVKCKRADRDDRHDDERDEEETLAIRDNIYARTIVTFTSGPNPLVTPWPTEANMPSTSARLNDLDIITSVAPQVGAPDDYRYELLASSNISDNDAPNSAMTSIELTDGVFKSVGPVATVNGNTFVVTISAKGKDDSVAEGKSFLLRGFYTFPFVLK